VKFKIDENLPVEAAGLLRGAGHDALTVHDQDIKGISDSALATLTANEHRAVITLDAGFADIRRHPPEHHPGVIVLRPAFQDRQHLLTILSGIIPLLDREPVEGWLWIVEEGRVRMHGGPGPGAGD